MTPDDLGELKEAVATERGKLNAQLEILEGSGHDATVEAIRRQVDQLASNIELIERGRPELLQTISEEGSTRRMLSAVASTALFPAVDTSMDNQFYHLMSKFNAPETTGAPMAVFTEDDILRYSHLAALSADVVLGHTILSAASLTQHPTFVEHVHETYDSTAERMERNIAYLSDNGGPQLEPNVIPMTERMLEAGRGEQNLFDALGQRLELTVNEKNLIDANAQILHQLLITVDGLAVEIQQASDAAVAGSGQAASTGRIILLIIGAFGVAGILGGAVYAGSRSG